jgi:hypothetical protein
MSNSTAEQDDTLRDAIALARAMLAEDNAAAGAILDNTRSIRTLAKAAIWLAMLAWTWPEMPTAADRADMDSELARFLQVANGLLA